MPIPQTQQEPEFLAPKFPAVIDSTMRADFNACPALFMLRDVYGLRPAGTNVHLNAGGAYAKGLETFRKAYFFDNLDFSDARALGAEALIREYGDPQDIPEDHPKSWHRTLEAYKSYLVEWPPATDPLKPHEVEGAGTIEFSFAMPLPIHHPETGDPIIFAGRFDMLAELNATLFVVDDKTTSRLGPTWADQWRLRSQFTGYVWAARQFGYPVAGAVIRGTAILKTKITHAEAIVYRPAHLIDRWYNRLLWDVQRMVNYWNQNFFPNCGEESGACSHYGGCAYADLCDKADWEEWADTNYIVDRWNPIQT